LERAPGQLLLVAARPGVGKTALMVQGFGATLRTGERALFISLELSEAELEARLAAWFTGTHARRLRDGRYEATTVFKAREDQAAFERASYLCMPSNTPWNVLEAEIRCAVHQDNVSSVWLDYFTLIQRPVGQKGQTDAALWGQLSTQIRALAQSLGLVFVLASQLNRGSTEYEEPGLSDLRETGQLEQDAHAVLMLWKGKEGAGEFPMGKLAKNRGGEKTMRTRLWCEYATNRWNVETRETTPSAPAGRGRL
jgi:replicative DNA helicase